MRGALAVLTLAACLAPPFALAQTAEPAQTQAQPAPQDQYEDIWANEPAPADEGANADPWEDFNRAMFATHEAVDRAVLEPVTRGYRAVTPEPVRNSVRSFLRNLRSPVILANDLLQGEFSRAGRTVVRFGLNSTVGFLGLFDPATGLGIERHDEDFGQTLAVWGVDSGPYLFIPLMGPTTLRDGGGMIVDTAFHPMTYARFENADTVRVASAALSGISARESVLDTVDGIRSDSLDPYVTIRTSYLLLRRSAIQNGRMDVQDLPDFNDSFLDGLETGSEPPAEAGDSESTSEGTGETPQHSDQNQAPGIE